MSKDAVAIQYNFTDGSVHNTTWTEGFGIGLMKLTAKLTSPLEYTGLSLLHRTLRGLLPSTRHIETQLFPDTKFAFPYGDAYWGVLLDNSTFYSPEVENFLIKMRHVDYAFIDCGANYGYMSAIMTSDTYGNKPCIAIEADPGTFKILQQNASLNDDRFEILNRAIFSVSGQMVDMSGAKHEARSILGDSGEVLSGNVETVALDDLLDWVDAQKKDKVMLKLDVEGVEIDAMNGARELLKRNLVIMYEDHASDLAHETSKFFFELPGMRIFYPDGTTCEEMKSLDDIKNVKQNPRVGYDFVATSSPEWLAEILALPSKSQD